MNYLLKFNLFRFTPILTWVFKSFYIIYVLILFLNVRINDRKFVKKRIRALKVASRKIF